MSLGFAALFASISGLLVMTVLTADFLERLKSRLESDPPSTQLEGEIWRSEQERLARADQQRIQEMPALRWHLKRLLWVFLEF